jgi:hypothetical protein
MNMGVRSQRHMVEIVGYSSGGTDYSQGGWGPNTVQPEIASMDPDTAFVGDADIDVHIYGSGFVPTSQLIVEGAVASRSIVSENEMVFTIQPSKVTAATISTIYVQNGWYYSSVVNFTFTDPPPLE